MPLRVTQVLASVDDQSAGPSYSVARLSAALASKGLDVTIRSVNGWRGDQKLDAAHECSKTPILIRSPLNQGWLARRICSSDDLCRQVRIDAIKSDVIHTHGLWLMPNVYPSRAIAQKGAQASVVLSPRGMLGDAALNFSRAKKTFFWSLVQRRAVAAASLLHATSESELQEIRAFGLRNPVTVIPNGIDVPILLNYEVRRNREILYLGRVHPKKGIDVLIRAWASIALRKPDWRLRIVGPPEAGYDRELMQIVNELRVPRISIEGPAYGLARLNAYCSASLFVLPTLNENFAMVVAEALAARLPAIVSRGAPWSGLEVERCGWWVDHGVETFAATIDAATELEPEELAAMGARGRSWMERDFGWARVADSMHEAYLWLKQGGTPPNTIHLV